MPEPIPIRPQQAAPVDLDALAEITEAVESGLGLPEVVRAAARALDASLVLIDRSSSVLAVAARSTADERQLMRDAEMVVDDGTITSHVKRIRKKFLAVDPAFAGIETVYGMGYRWMDKA